MKRRTFPIFLAVTLMALTSAVRAAENGGATWLTNYAAALQEGLKTQKPVLIDFTGSDWCPPCMMLHKDVFSKSAFVKFAKDNLVLLELDYPQTKPQSDELQKQNAELYDQYQIQGFPTIMLLSPNGKELARSVGYLPGGPAAMIDWIHQGLGEK